jgi:hypothetical protein
MTKMDSIMKRQTPTNVIVVTDADVPVTSPDRTALVELALRLAVALAVQDVRAQRGSRY